MSYFLLYLILMLDNIHGLFVAFIMLPLIGIPTVLLVLTCIDDSEEKAFSIFKTYFKIAIPILIIGCIGVVFCPNTKQAATIYLLPKIASNKDMQQLPSKTAELLLLEVKKEIASLDVGNISGITNAVKKK